MGVLWTFVDGGYASLWGIAKASKQLSSLYLPSEMLLLSTDSSREEADSASNFSTFRIRLQQRRSQQHISLMHWYAHLEKVFLKNL